MHLGLGWVLLSVYTGRVCLHPNKDLLSWKQHFPCLAESDTFTREEVEAVKKGSFMEELLF